jgi:hypothetical protein
MYFGCICVGMVFLLPKKPFSLLFMVVQHGKLAWRGSSVDFISRLEVRLSDQHREGYILVPHETCSPALPVCLGA